jgi:mRNA interferase RelE/StbE
MRRLDITRDALRFLTGLDAKRFRQVMLKVLDLMRDATPQDSEALKGFEGRRVDIGEYRIIYRFDASTLYVVVIGKRNDDEVYRQLKDR